MKWKKLANGKWQPLTKNVKEFDYYMTNDFKKKLMLKLKEIWVYCEICKSKYNLAVPCIHHLSDSPEHQKQYLEQRRKQKQAKSSEPVREYKGLYE